MRLSFLTLSFVLASSVGAQAARITPGTVYLVNLSHAKMQVSLNGAASVTALPMSVAPAWQTTPVAIGKRSSAESPAAGVMASGMNVLSITWGGVSYVAHLQLGPIGPLSSPGGLSSTCVVYVTLFSTPATATLACVRNGEETTLTSGPLGLP